MHDLYDPTNAIDPKIAVSSDLEGKECCCCYKLLGYKVYRRDSSSRDGRADRCLTCESAPRLSTYEHLVRLKELNLSSAGVRKQQFSDQTCYTDVAARTGHMLHSNEIIRLLTPLLKKAYGVQEVWALPAPIIGDINLYLLSGRKRDDWSVKDNAGNDCPMEIKNFGYVSESRIYGPIPEYSIYEFDGRDIPVRKLLQGWRDILLKAIKSRLVDEYDAHRVFGQPHGFHSVPYQQQLYAARNGHLPA